MHGKPDSHRTALITGGGTGIGLAIARAFRARGLRVALCGRREAPLEEAARALGTPGEDTLAIPADVTDKAAVDRLVSAVVDRWGPIHVLVNNAGVSGITPIHEDAEARWRAILETNLTGMYLVTQRVLREMPDHAHGRIVNVSSVLGKFGVPGYTAYCTAKHGVIGFTRSLALEVVHRGITVNAVCPGWVDTAMAEQGMRETARMLGTTYEAFKAEALSRVPIKRFVEGEEVAALVCYLTSEAAAGMTGQAINICGGATTA